MRKWMRESKPCVWDTLFFFRLHRYLTANYQSGIIIWEICHFMSRSISICRRKVKWKWKLNPSTERWQGHNKMNVHETQHLENLFRCEKIEEMENTAISESGTTLWWYLKDHVHVNGFWRVWSSTYWLTDLNQECGMQYVAMLVFKCIPSNSVDYVLAAAWMQVAILDEQNRGKWVSILTFETFATAHLISWNWHDSREIYSREKQKLISDSFSFIQVYSAFFFVSRSFAYSGSVFVQFRNKEMPRMACRMTS